MTRRKMLLLIIGSLITVSTAVGVGVNFATANGSSQESSIKGIDTSSPITKDSEETKVIDKEEDKSPSTPPAKVEINDKRKASQNQIKDKQEPVKQTTPPTNSPVVVRKEGGTSNTNNKGTQLIIGDVSKLNLPQKENKEESKDSQSKPAVVIINKGTPTPPPAKEVKKSEEQSGSGKQNSTDAPVVVAGQPQPQKTSPQEKKEEKEIANNSNEQQTQGESSRQGSEVQVEVSKEKQTEEAKSPESQPSQPSQPSDIDDSESNSTPSTQIELTNNNEQNSTNPKLTASQTKINEVIGKFTNINNGEIDQLAKDHTIKPEEYKLFFGSIPKEWTQNQHKYATQLSNLRTFWDFNWLENLKAGGMDETILSRSKDLKKRGDEKFFEYLNLAQTGQLGHNITASGGAIKVEGVPKGDLP